MCGPDLPYPPYACMEQQLIPWLPLPSSVRLLASPLEFAGRGGGGLRLEGRSGSLRFGVLTARLSTLRRCGMGRRVVL
jgi:hypothetical protein